VTLELIITTVGTETVYR